jgi:hypothetical protein
MKRRFAMKKSFVPALSAVVLVVLLAISAGFVFAGSSNPSEEEISPAQVNGDVQNYFPLQGRLTDASGNPLNGDYSITFRLYDAYTGGTALCSDTNTVKVNKGLFSTEVWGTCANYIKGAQLYLSIEVEGNGEMEPRQPIFAVPYAWSLRPGAIIIGAVVDGATLHIENSDPGGRGLRAYAMSTTGVNYGLVASAKSPDGFGAYIYNNGGGTGLKAESSTGAAIQATGSGIIQSSALSYLWISGSGLRPYLHTDSTTIDMDTVGGAIVKRGEALGNKNVMLPITITGPLYGQNVTVTGMDIYFKGDTASDFISVVLLRRQTGVCSGASCYATILADNTDLICNAADNPTGCSHHWNITTNNVLSANSGFLYLTLELAFSGSDSKIEIGGVRLTLAHD